MALNVQNYNRNVNKSLGKFRQNQSNLSPIMSSRLLIGSSDSNSLGVLSDDSTFFCKQNFPTSGRSNGNHYALKDILGPYPDETLMFGFSNYFARNSSSQQQKDVYKASKIEQILEPNPNFQITSPSDQMSLASVEKEPSLILDCNSNHNEVLNDVSLNGHSSVKSSVRPSKSSSHNSERNELTTSRCCTSIGEPLPTVLEEETHFLKELPKDPSPKRNSEENRKSMSSFKVLSDRVMGWNKPESKTFSIDSDNDLDSQVKSTEEPIIIKTRWALTRVNVFSDRARTYEIMQLLKETPIPNLPNNISAAFAVLPNGTTIGYDSVKI